MTAKQTSRRTASRSGPQNDSQASRQHDGQVGRVVGQIDDPAHDNHPADLEGLDRDGLLQVAAGIGLHVNPDGSEEQLRGELVEEYTRRGYPGMGPISTAP